MGKRIKVVYLGTWEKKYSRNRIIINGLKRANADVELFHIETVWNKKTHKTKLSKIRIILDLIKSYFLMIYYFFKIRTYDYIVIGYPGWFDVPLTWLLNKFRPGKLVFDSYFSIYDSIVNDRKSVRAKSLYARLLFFTDKICCRLADIILLDTDEHINYFVNTFKIRKNKFIRVFIGADDKIFYPKKRKKKNKRFKVIFHGKFIPLQGLSYIIEAAKLLEKQDIEFEIIGDGQLKEDIVKLSKKLNTNNIHFTDFVPVTELPGLLFKADVGLGIFGDTEKAKRVIPNKAFEILAMKLPLITGDSPAAREVLENKKHCILCKMADPDALAKSILLLKNNPLLRKKISINGHRLFRERFSVNAIGRDLKKTLVCLCNKKDL
ncbi:glycosyltransferase family 4 protein [Candidatus Woesearchaeota archaeon]|nr:glycosyltransferase family 4 protein [Candidatus Woesearchaeota archaeon]